MRDASLTAHALSAGWEGQTQWAVLDAEFAKGDVFFALCEHWRNALQRPARLNIVGILSLEEARSLPAGLLPQGAPLLTGFQRFLFEAGALTLTLCVGEADAMLREIRMVADRLLHAGPPPDRWRLKALVRLCARGSRIVFDPASKPVPGLLRELGLLPLTGIGTDGTTAPALIASEYAPHWAQRRPIHRNPDRPGRAWPANKHAVVIGAGLAGASAARALAVRGWRVTVLDQHSTPAQGASGLPVGLLVPHVSIDDSPRSRMARAGVRLMMQHAQAHLTEGQDWACTGVLELHTHLSPRHRPIGWEQAGAPHIEAAGWGRGLADADQSLWHPWAAWIKPLALVRAWLDHPSIEFRGNVRVQSLRSVQEQWQVVAQAAPPPNSSLNAAQVKTSDREPTIAAELALADAVLFCNANGAPGLVGACMQSGTDGAAQAATWVPDLAGKMEAMQTLYGTLSYGPQSATLSAQLPDMPVNGSGSLIPGVHHVLPDGSQQACWFAGSTFETEAASQADALDQHQKNQAKLALLLPAVGQALLPHLERAWHWQSSRCVSHDRLPLVGALELSARPSLWISAGMGARGLSFAALCAELLAAEMEAEPLPLEASLAKLLAANRPRRGAKKSDVQLP